MPDRLAQLAAQVWEHWSHRRYADALPLAAEYCELAGAQPGQPGQRRYAYGLNMLGALSYQLGDFPRADFLLRQSLAIFRGMSDDGRAHCAEVMQNLVRVCLHFGNREEAEALAREALALLEAQFGIGHPNITRARRQFANLLRAAVNLDAPAQPEPPTAPEPVTEPEAPLVADPEPREAWRLVEGRGEHEHGFLAITPHSLIWRAAATGRKRSFPLPAITAFGISPGGTVLYLDVEGDPDRHHFDVGPGGDLWVYVIFDAIRNAQPLSEACLDKVAVPA
ncbi:MAG: tetratricopeptide repeat protein [Armatimonadota bacterium]